MSTLTVNVCKTIEVYEDVELKVDDIVHGLDAADRTLLLSRLGGTAANGLGCGDGDAARRHNIIERAYTAALNMPELPREIRDLFWLVHDRAL